MRFPLIRTVSRLLYTQSRLLRFFFSFTLKPFFFSSSSTSVRFFSSLLSHHRFLVALFFIRNVFNHLLSFSSLPRFICCSLFHIYFFYRIILILRLWMFFSSSLCSDQTIELLLFVCLTRFYFIYFCLETKN